MIQNLSGQRLDAKAVTALQCGVSPGRNSYYKSLTQKMPFETAATVPPPDDPIVVETTRT